MQGRHGRNSITAPRAQSPSVSPIVNNERVGLTRRVRRMASEVITSQSSESTGLVESRAAKMIREVFESGRALTYIRSAEEARVTAVLREVGGGLLASGPAPVWVWSMTEGMKRDGGPAERGSESPRAALDFIVAHEGPAI